MIVRKIKPVVSFAELHNTVSNVLFPGEHDILLRVSGTPNIVGSQDEYMLAFEESENRAILNLDVILVPLKVIASPSKSPASLKRKHSGDEEPLFPNEGPFSDIEEAYFSDGVKTFGWSKWLSIAKHMRTRNRIQVGGFSKTKRGLAYRPANIQSILQATEELASTAKNLADILKSHVKEK